MSNQNGPGETRGRRRFLEEAVIVALGAVSAPVVLGGLAMLADCIEISAHQRRQREFFEQRAAQIQAAREAVESTGHKVRAVRDSKVATAARADGRGAVWLDFKNPGDGNRIYIWPHSDGFGFRLTHRHADSATIVDVWQEEQGFAVENSVSHANGTSGHLVRRAEFYNNGVIRVFDGIPTVDGDTTEVERTASEAAGFVTGLMQYAQSVLDKAE